MDAKNPFPNSFNPGIRANWQGVLSFLPMAEATSDERGSQVPGREMQGVFTVKIALTAPAYPDGKCLSPPRVTQRKEQH